MKFFAIASFSFLLSACTAPQTPAAVVASPAEIRVPVAISEAPASEAPVARRAPGSEETGLLQTLRAFGTEPFWSVKVENDRLTFTTPEDQEGV